MLQKLLKYSLPLILAAAFSLPSSAQGKVGLKGRVTTVEDGKNVPLDYVVVLLKPSGLYATTDAEGRYEFKGLDRGGCDISVQMIGYATIEEHIDLNKDMVRDFVLQESNFRLNEVQVTATRNKAGDATASIISRQAIDHSQTSSLSDVMQLLPGVSFSNPDLSQAQSLNLRTVGASDMNSLGTAVIMDGAPVSNNANMEGITSAMSGTLSTVAGAAGSSAGALPNSGIDVRQISTDNIESIEVIRGIPSVQYGDLTSGAVIINSKAGAEPLTVRIKTDPKIFQTSASKGFRLGEKAGDIHFSGDYAYSNPKTTEAYAFYQRFNFKTMYTKRFGNLNSSFSADLRYGRDVRMSNPDDIRSDLASGGMNIGWRVNANGTWNINKGWFKTLRYDVSNSYTYKDSYREQTTTNAVSIYSTNMTDGTTVSNVPGQRLFDPEGNEITSLPAGKAVYSTMTPYSYFCHYDFYGKELNTFAKVTANLFRQWGGTSEKILLGADFKSDGNLGKGLVFEEGAPPVKASNAEAGYRERPLYEIPFVHQTGLFAENSFRTEFLARTFNLTAGVRYDLIEGLSALSPRLNTSLDIFPKVLTIRGGYGITAKAPTTMTLYPNPAYYDQVNINRIEAPDPSDRVVMATTHIYDTTNPELEIAKNRKYEAGFDLTIARRYRLSVTFYDELMRNGYSFASTFSTWQWVPYKTYAPAGKDLDGNNVFSLERDTNRFFTYYMPTNTSKEHNYGVEYELDLGRFEAIRTSFYLNGAWMHTMSTSTGCTFDLNMDHGSTIGSNVSVYDPEMRRYHNEKAVTTLRITHNIPSIGFVVTLTSQLNLFTSSWTDYTNDIYPQRYISQADGKVYDFTAEMASDPQYSYMLDPRSDSRFIVSRTHSTLVFNLNVSKEVHNFMTASFYVNNLFNSRPLDPSEVTRGAYTELNNPMYFGFELKFKI